MIRAVTALLLLAIAAVGPISEAHAERRVALVIGNSDYRHTAPLLNPRNDAADVAGVLRKLGFTVVEGIDLDKLAMERRIRDFAAALDGADVGLFFYAGHGLQVDGKNFLAPIDATLKSETDLDFEAVQLNLVLRQLERHARLSLVFLDACRDNPMATTLARSLKQRSRSASVGRGLARVEKAVGMMISFATQPGNVALDGEGRNSPFTKALLKNIESQGATIGDMMIQVRNDVIAATDGKQVPWENSSLTGKFYFKPEGATGPKVVTARHGQLDVPNTTFDHTFWTSIRDSDDPALYREYLRRFPDGVFTPIAKSKLSSLQSIGGDDAATAAKPTVARPDDTAGRVEQARLPRKDEAAVSADDRGEAPPIDPEAAKLQLARDTQTALKRLGCYTGKIDGKWGRGSRAAMGRFNRVARQDLPLQPSGSSLEVIKSMYFYKGRRCAVATKPRAAPKQAKRTSPKRKAKRSDPKKKATRTSSKKTSTRTSRKTQTKRTSRKTQTKPVKRSSRSDTRTRRTAEPRRRSRDRGSEGRSGGTFLFGGGIGRGGGLIGGGIGF